MDIKESSEEYFGRRFDSGDSSEKSDICRICHCESEKYDLLAPCYCSGSMKYVHMHCLQQWLTSSESNACELCKFPFIMHTKIKPFNEWRGLEMSGVERRRLFCAILFHFAAATCVLWSLFVLIERAAEEMKRGMLGWPFWTKLVVVSVGVTGGVIFMYIQCRQYLHLCNRWRARNRILLIQNAPDKLREFNKSNNMAPLIYQEPPPPSFSMDDSVAVELRMGSSASSFISNDQIIANIENPRIAIDSSSMRPASQGSSSACVDPVGMNSYSGMQSTSPVFLENKDILSTDFRSTKEIGDSGHYSNNIFNLSQGLSSSKMGVIEPQPQITDIIFELTDETLANNSLDPLELNIQELLQLDIATNRRIVKSSCVSINSDPQKQYQQQQSSDEDEASRKHLLHKSLPNLHRDNNLLG